MELLLEWLDTLRRGATALHHYTRQGIRARIVQQGDRLRCPVCELFNGREVRRGSDTMPPIHPGCRCVLVALTAVPLADQMGARARTANRVCTGEGVLVVVLDDQLEVRTGVRRGASDAEPGALGFG